MDNIETKKWVHQKTNQIIIEKNLEHNKYLVESGLKLECYWCGTNVRRWKKERSCNITCDECYEKIEK